MCVRRAALYPNGPAGSYVNRIRLLLPRGFVGREWIFDEIGTWLREASQRRVLCITGEPYGQADDASGPRLSMGGLGD